jgi:hypothetical protein
MDNNKAILYGSVFLSIALLAYVFNLRHNNELLKLKIAELESEIDNQTIEEEND